MKTINFEPVLFTGAEIVLLVAAVLVFLVLIGGVVALVIWLRRRNERRDAPPQTPPATPTQRVCQGCGKEISAAAPQGLCPTCLMNVALGSEGGNPAGAGERKPAPPPADIARHFPHLEILELLGQGGMGAVYKARHRNLDRMVALKILPPHSATDAGFAERFNREARALAKLSHPNIVAVYDFGQADGLHYLTMEFVDGLNLRQLEQAGKLPPREALQIIPQICEALQFAHDEGIVHRDIKPENVLLDKKGRVKIADFGLARILGREPESFRLTGAKDFMGTPHYMAPEQIEHPQAVDHRADIYSLGVVFYEMLTGELPLGRFAPPSSRMRGLQIDVRLDEVVLRALEKEPERRYQHASEVKTDVETITGKPELAAPKVARADDTRLHAQVRKAAFGLLLVAALHLIVLPLTAIGVGWLRSQTAPPRLELMMAVILFNTLVSGFIFYGGRKMERLESWRLAIAASITLLGLTIGNLAGVVAGKLDGVFLTPGFLFDLLLGTQILAPGDIAGIPMAVWALVILSKPDVKAMFARAALPTSQSLPPAFSQKLVAHLTWALPTAALILGLGFLLRQPRAPAPAEAPTLQTPTEISEEKLSAPLEDAQREVLQVRLNQAEEAVVLAETKFKAGLISQFELDGAKDDAELLRAEIIGDPLRAAGVRLASAERRLVHAEGRFKAGLIGDSEYRNAKNAVELEKVKVRAIEGRRGANTSTPASPTSATTQPGELEFRLVATDGDTLTSADELADPYDRTGQTKLRVLKEVLLDSSAVASASLASSHTDHKEISVVLKDDAARKFADITAANLGRRLAIIWRGRVLSAPVIRTPISSPILVTGIMSDAETQVLLTLLNYKASKGK